jgi:hypothetical protein
MTRKTDKGKKTKKKDLEYWLNADFIEPRIRRLVAYFNQIPFLKTTSSCEGHFSEDDFNFAYVMYKIREGCRIVEGEKKIEKMLSYIIPKIAVYWSDFLGDFSREYQIGNKNQRSDKNIRFSMRYWDLPEPENYGIKKQYMLQIEPFMWHKKNYEECRKITDNAISIIERIIEEYLRKKGWL